MHDFVSVLSVDLKNSDTLASLISSAKVPLLIQLLKISNKVGAQIFTLSLSFFMFTQVVVFGGYWIFKKNASTLQCHIFKIIEYDVFKSSTVI